MLIGSRKSKVVVWTIRHNLIGIHIYARPIFGVLWPKDLNEHNAKVKSKNNEEKCVNQSNATHKMNALKYVNKKP